MTINCPLDNTVSDGETCQKPVLAGQNLLPDGHFLVGAMTKGNCPHDFAMRILAPIKTIK